MNLCLCEFMYPISLRNFSHIQERLLQPLYKFLGVRRKTVGLPGPTNPAGKLSGGWLPRDAQHMTFREEMRCCLGSSLQWLLLPLHFRIRLSTAGLHMELGHMLVSAQLGTSIALPCLLRGGRHGRLPLLTWRRGLEWWGRLLPCRKPQLFFFLFKLCLGEFLSSVWKGFFEPYKPYCRRRNTLLAVCRASCNRAPLSFPVLQIWRRVASSPWPEEVMLKMHIQSRHLCQSLPALAQDKVSLILVVRN